MLAIMHENLQTITVSHYHSMLNHSSAALYCREKLYKTIKLLPTTTKRHYVSA